VFKNKRNRYLLIFIVAIIVIILMIFSLIPTSIVNKGSSPISFIVRPIENLINTISVNSKNYFSAIELNKQLTEENKNLTEQNVDLRLQVKENEAAAIEYEKLKNVYNISNKYDYLNFIGARILQKPLGKDLNLYRIDRGLDAGINLSEKSGFPVIDADANVFGRIYNSDALTAKVLPVTSEGFSVSCFISENRGQAFIFKGDVELKQQGLCKIEDVPAESIVNIGDEIYTSGLGGVFPYGLLLGEVVEISPLNSQGTQTILVEPAIDFKTIENVFVLTNDLLPDNLEDPDDESRFREDSSAANENEKIDETVQETATEILSEESEEKEQDVDTDTDASEVNESYGN